MWSYQIHLQLLKSAWMRFHQFRVLIPKFFRRKMWSHQIPVQLLKVSLDEIPSTSSVDSPVPRSHAMEVNPFHVIFNLNKILIATHFNRGSCIVTLHLGLKEFMEKCLAQFQIYIWFVAQCHNIYNYLDQIWRKTQFFIFDSKVLD